MTGLLICAAAVAAFLSWLAAGVGGYDLGSKGRGRGRWGLRLSLPLLAVALWLAYAAGGTA